MIQIYLCTRRGALGTQAGRGEQGEDGRNSGESAAEGDAGAKKEVPAEGGGESSDWCDDACGQLSTPSICSAHAICAIGSGTERCSATAKYLTDRESVAIRRIAWLPKRMVAPIATMLRFLDCQRPHLHHQPELPQFQPENHPLQAPLPRAQLPSSSPSRAPPPSA